MRERVDIDRLRALHVRLAAYLTRADVLEMVSAVPALLDAAEERDRLRQSLDAANDALDASGKTTFRIREERDDARAQLDAVERLTAELESRCRFADALGGREMDVAKIEAPIARKLRAALTPKAPITTPTEEPTNGTV